MHRSITHSLRWLDSHRALENLNLRLHRFSTRAWTLRIYCVDEAGLEETLAQLPELLRRRECQTIKEEKKISVFRIPLRLGQTIRWVYVKQHTALTPGYRLASICYASAARRSLCGAFTLLHAGYATARPVAAVEQCHFALLRTSFYLSEEIAGAKNITNHWREDLALLKGVDGYRKRRAVLRALARLFQSLHRQGIYHNDLKASNILALDQGPAAASDFSLIDVQGVRKCLYISERRKIKNLAQLNRTLGKFLSQTEKLVFVKAYMGQRTYDRRKQRRFIHSILEATRRQIIRERVRHPAEECEELVGRTSEADGLGKKEAAGAAWR